MPERGAQARGDGDALASRETHLRLGLAGGPVPTDPALYTADLAAGIAGMGVSVLVTHFQMAPDELVASGSARRVRQVLDDHGLSIVQASGYNPMLIHPDPTVRRAELGRLAAAFGAASELGAEMVITGCGSLHPTMFYGPSAANHDGATRERLVVALREAVVYAADIGIPLVLECHVMTTLDTPSTIREVVDAVDSAWLKVNFDPVNLLGDLASVYESGSRMDEMWRALGPHYAKTAHLKDVRPEPEFVVKLSEVAPGEGLLDMGMFFEICKRLGSGTAVIIEHLPIDRVSAAVSFATAAAQRHGARFDSGSPRGSRRSTPGSGIVGR